MRWTLTDSMVVMLSTMLLTLALGLLYSSTNNPSPSEVKYFRYMCPKCHQNCIRPESDVIRFTDSTAKWDNWSVYPMKYACKECKK